VGKVSKAKKTKIKAKNGQTKKINLGWHMDKKDNPINSPSIHIGALVGVGSLWPTQRNVFGIFLFWR
jgi:hypothetical protein